MVPKNQEKNLDSKYIWESVIKTWIGWVIHAQSQPKLHSPEKRGVVKLGGGARVACPSTGSYGTKTVFQPLRADGFFVSSFLWQKWSMKN